VLQATIYDPHGAAEVGYVDAVVSPADLLATARAEAARLGLL
jgi:enoyl-CoA hydratase/carnithine racemase